MDIAEVLQFMYPTAEFVITNNDLDSIVWHTKGFETPTIDEIASSHEAMIIDKQEKTASKEAARQAVLTKLGLSADEVAALLA